MLINVSESHSDKRILNEFTKDVCNLAESDTDIPIVKSNYKELKQQLVTSGTNE